MLAGPARAASRGSAGPARRRFWILLTVAVLAGGVMSSALAVSPSPQAGVAVALGGLVLIGSVAGAARIMLALERAQLPRAKAVSQVKLPFSGRRKRR